MYLCVLTYLSQLEQFLIFEFICENNVIVNTHLFLQNVRIIQKGKSLYFLCMSEVSILYCVQLSEQESNI